MLIIMFVRRSCAQPASPPGNKNKWSVGGKRERGGWGWEGGEVSPSCGGSGAGRTFAPCLHRGASLSASPWLDLFGY